MITNILQYLEKTVGWLPEKKAFWDDWESLTFLQLSQQAKAIGSYLAASGITRKPVAVYMKRRPKVTAAFFGTIYAGCWYVPMDEEMPIARVERILQKVQPGAILCDEYTAPNLSGTHWEERCCTYEDAAAAAPDENLLQVIRQQQIDMDPCYVVFTSGSTGEPKGVIACHRNVIDYIEQLGKVIGASSNSVFGGQAPFYFDACLKEILCTVKYGGSCCILPRSLFLFPLRLVDALNRNHINTICWVASALTFISSTDTFSLKVPEYLHTVVFAGEAFPTRQLALWQKVLPEARMINLYGPTEATGTSCYYEIDRAFGLEESIPIGRPFPNTGILLLDENGKEAETGEICIRGSCLTLGYFRDPERTNASFIQNPTNPDYPEKLYRTGDYGTRNEHGELVFLGRKDSQIKHMGHRIELGEIEAAAASHPAVHFACCQYEQTTGRIQLFYSGDCSCQEITGYLRERLPKYMLPKSLYLLEWMPLTPGGKIDRTALQRNARKGVYAYESVNEHSGRTAS